MGDKSLDRFRVEYEKLHSALKRSHENEKKLIKKCRELNQELNVRILQNARTLALDFAPLAPARCSSCRRLTAALRRPLQSNAQKVQQALKMSRADQNNVLQLKKVALGGERARPGSRDTARRRRSTRRGRLSTLHRRRRSARERPSRTSRRRSKSCRASSTRVRGKGAAARRVRETLLRRRWPQHRSGERRQ